jgi:hypothetical protein
VNPPSSWPRELILSGAPDAGHRDWPGRQSLRPDRLPAPLAHPLLARLLPQAPEDLQTRPLGAGDHPPGSDVGRGAAELPGTRALLRDGITQGSLRAAIARAVMTVAPRRRRTGRSTRRKGPGWNGGAKTPATALWPAGNSPRPRSSRWTSGTPPAPVPSADGPPPPVTMSTMSATKPADGPAFAMAAPSVGVTIASGSIPNGMWTSFPTGRSGVGAHRFRCPSCFVASLGSRQRRRAARLRGY